MSNEKSFVNFIGILLYIISRFPFAAFQYSGYCESVGLFAFIFLEFIKLPLIKT